jgi:LDH2 family malate/lactate/ureidoglycolate dehydrogenase
VTDEARRVPAALLRAQAEAILAAWGMDGAAARTTAEVMAETDLAGVDSHGISMLPLYDRMRRAGQLDLRAEVRTVRESATTALLDAGAGLGHPAGVAAMGLAVEKALAHDLGAVAVFNSHHFGAAGHYALMAARRGAIGIVASSTRFVTMVPTFGAEPVLGTNPLAVAVPAGRNEPVLLDMATTVVAANKIKVYDYWGKALPAGWVVDGAGLPVTDAAEGLRTVLERPEGGLNPIGGAGMDLGGHKGYGLALVVHLLGGALTGGSFSPLRNRTQKPGDPDNIGHLFLALNPAAFRPPEDFLGDVDAVIETLHGARPADPAQQVLVPGDPERATRAERLARGVPVPGELAAQIRALAEAAGAPYLLG